MPEVVSKWEEPPFIHIKSSGDITFEDLKLSLREIKRIKTEHGYNKVFVDHREGISFPREVPAFNFGVEIGMFFKDLVIAILISEGEEKEVDYFVKAVNARGGKVKVFNSEPESQEWLKNQ